MIPVKLTLSGFLSYREEAHIDFSQLEVACISGANGAGKSSLFDAITWALFGRARRNDDAVINDGSQVCKVVLEFDYEGSLYRVERIKERGKTGRLEFQVISEQGKWKPMTEAGLRATEDRIQQTLRLDYDTFINSSFFLQGKADMFTQQTPAKRKEILSSILGLEVWETYREEANRRRRAEQEDRKVQQQLLEEIQTELEQEQERREKLNLVSQNLESTTKLRQEKEKSWNQAQSAFQQTKAAQEKLDMFSTRLNEDQQRLDGITQQLSERQIELQNYEKTLQNSEEISKAYQAWRDLQQELEKWNKLAEEFHQLNNDRLQVDALLGAEEAKLKQELDQLQTQKSEIDKLQKGWPALEEALKKDKEKAASLEEAQKELSQVEEKLAEHQTSISELAAENKQLSAQMKELRANIDTLEKSAGPQCPLCDQPLTEEHRSEIVDQYEARGKALKELFLENKRLAEISQIEQDVLKKRQADLRRAQAELVTLQRDVGQKEQRAQEHRQKLEKWEEVDSPRLEQVQEMLSEKTFSQTHRVQLQQKSDKIEKLGYSQDQHERCRRQEQEARAVDQSYRDLEKAKTAVESLRREVKTLQASSQELENKIKEDTAQRIELEHDLKEQLAAQPDLKALEAGLNELRKEENDLRQQVGAATQMVKVLEKQRQRKAEVNELMLEIKDRIANLRMLETAFSKDGIPALLIEQALPEIEIQANDILDRLSNGYMSIAFMTEREYKDKKREDKKQTLDILISDASGKRAYELFSGGEAFRINFAIRLALSRVLAQRAGARLQTLVIDEGFGSQDAEGRQRLIEAINLVSRDFAKILVITHLDELKDAFPSRIEVQKTQNGSVVEVIP
jgi:exonuclease SbcC